MNPRRRVERLEEGYGFDGDGPEARTFFVGALARFEETGRLPGSVEGYSEGTLAGAAVRDTWGPRPDFH